MLYYYYGNVTNVNQGYYYIDVNKDSQNDLRFTLRAVSSLGGGDGYIAITSLNSNTSKRFSRLDTSTNKKVALPLSVSDSINAKVSIWDTTALYIAYDSYYMSVYKTIPDWYTNTDMYAGIRYQDATDTIYGWIRINCKKGGSNIYCLVKDFSFQSTCHVVPSLNTASSSTLICSGETATLSANGVGTYTWSTGANGQNIIVTPTITTNYTVSGTTSNGCLLNSIITQSVNACIGIKEYNKSIPSIYPNPANNKLQLKGIDEVKKCSLITLDGKEIPLKQNLNNEFDVSAVPEGIYFLQLKTDEGVLTKKIVIQH